MLKLFMNLVNNMRLRKIARAEGFLKEHKEIVVTDLSDFNIDNCFNNNKEIHLEIGCGKGQFSINMAKNYQDINFIALEKYDSVLLRAVEKYLNLEEKPTNLLFILSDVLDFMPKINDHKINTIYLNFSDPWPKNPQAKRRLTNINFLKQYQRILVKDGLIIQKTDNLDLFNYSLIQYKLAGFKILEEIRDLHNSNIFNITTEFEDKWSKLGPIYYAKVKV